MARVNLSCLFPASWHFSLSLRNTTARQKIVFAGVFFTFCLLFFLIFMEYQHWRSPFRDKELEKYMARIEDMEATDTDDVDLNYGVVVDCGSSGSRVFVYFWPQHNGNPHDLLDIKQMKDKNRKPVVKKIKPGISTLASSPAKASDYLRPLLQFAATHVPVTKHKETPLYILCTAGMRLLPERQQNAILEDLYTDVPVEFDFLFSESHAEVISGKQEGVYAWIGINFVLGRFDHIEDDNDARVAVTVSSNPNQGLVIRKRTVGILDMGGASVQIAYEVTNPVSFTSPEQEEAAKGLLAEFNLGCDLHHTEHVYRVYVTTFLGFGGNYARQLYEDLIFNNTAAMNRLLDQYMGVSAESPYLDPCLSIESTDIIQKDEQTMHLRGAGNFDECCKLIKPLLNKGNEANLSLNGVYQSPIDFHNSEFYGFSEFYYCTEDVLRMGGHYDGVKYTKAAKDYCATKWTTLKERFDLNLFSSHADLHRLKYQCFKSAWMHEVLHSGFNFPVDYSNLKTAQLVYDKEVQWTLGAILYKTRFLPLRDLQRESGKANHSRWLRISFVYNHYLFFACFFVVLLAIALYILRLRRIHRRTQRELLWMEEGKLSTEGL
ncbi:ectonucleoside triphosphate diphosphohydrolase 4-like [Hemiscyllium ocellatum]|uniref:ectonucleoside triphosphate diphosphohydrolase 4-like n=1 Tax=Hemiscyllium ocellatum TaxID=170820 RepID=UPI002966E83F|nr:ectonucleoside triphosphate diphosphohydrolase 4-like [Hemiscyllium ocellatum]